MVFLLIAFAVSSLVFVSSSGSGLAQSGQTVNGIITQDTTWTKTNSPYNLTGNILIDNGITLTIEPGVIVNFNSHYILVNGTLTARGTSLNQISFYGAGQISFTPYSIAWNEQTDLGSIIEYAILSETAYTLLSVGIDGGSPMIRNNDMTASIYINGGSPTISSNNFTSFSYTDMYGREQGVITEIGVSGNSSPTITNNNIQGDIVIQSGSPTIQRNVISGAIGIDMGTLTSSANPTIENNTLSSCGMGIFVGRTSELTLTLMYNNFQNNKQYNINWQPTENLYAPNNWWGTTDQSAISSSIYDFKNDFNLGKVNFVPFLTSPNPQAVPNSNAPIPISNTSPTSNPTTNQSPTVSPTQNPTMVPFGGNNERQSIDWIQITLFTFLAVIAISLVVIAALLYKRNKLQSAASNTQKASL